VYSVFLCRHISYIWPVAGLCNLPKRYQRDVRAKIFCMQYSPAGLLEAVCNSWSWTTFHFHCSVREGWIPGSALVFWITQWIPGYIVMYSSVLQPHFRLCVFARTTRRIHRPFCLRPLNTFFAYANIIVLHVWIVEVIFLQYSAFGFAPFAFTLRAINPVMGPAH